MRWLITQGKIMKIGIILNTNDAETCWNGLRFGNEAISKNHTVKVFLLGKGVELEEIKSKQFNVKEQLDFFVKSKGEILACGTCLKSRHKKESKVCSISTMNDLLELVEESDKVLTFG